MRRPSKFQVVLFDPDEEQHYGPGRPTIGFATFLAAQAEADRLNRLLNETEGKPTKSPFKFWSVTSQLTLPDRAKLVLGHGDSKSRPKRPTRAQERRDAILNYRFKASTRRR
jgi:hypothetical protein